MKPVRTMNHKHITGLILAGGRGTRMGNADKGLQRLNGIPMVQHVLQRLTPQVGQIRINANRNLMQYRQFNVPIVSDTLPDYAGPLAGVQAGLLSCHTPFMATVPCDSPYFPEDLIARLVAALLDDKADIAIAATGQAQNRRQHPVFCLLRTTLLPHLNRYLQQGNRKFALWYQSLPTTEVYFEEEQAFLNINTREQLQQEAMPDQRAIP